jgi:hypothetical protein
MNWSTCCVFIHRRLWFYQVAAVDPNLYDCVMERPTDSADPDGLS